MTGITITDGFIDLLDTEFTCPKCGTVYEDPDEKILDRCDQNKSWITTVLCSCGQRFKATYDCTGKAVSFLSAMT